MKYNIKLKKDILHKILADRGYVKIYLICVIFLIKNCGRIWYNIVLHLEGVAKVWLNVAKCLFLL